MSVQGTRAAACMPPDLNSDTRAGAVWRRNQAHAVYMGRASIRTCSLASTTWPIGRYVGSVIVNEAKALLRAGTTRTWAVGSTGRFRRRR